MSTVLLTGSTGKTATPLAALLHSHNHPLLIATRKNTTTLPIPTSATTTTPVPATYFDWTDSSTWSLPFAQTPTITSIYLVPPPGHPSPSTLTNQFIDFARSKGVTRFVLLSGSPIEAGGPLLGGAHAYLQQLGREQGVEWAVLRPTWFMQNFLMPMSAASITKESRIYSATGDGRVPFVAAEDIAAVAYRALTDATPHNTDYLVLGPEPLSHEQVARILTGVLGREIRYVRSSVEEQAQRIMEFQGYGKEIATTVAEFEAGVVGKGMEDRTSEAVEKVTGKKPMGLEEFFTKNRAAWAV